MVIKEALFTAKTDVFGKQFPSTQKRAEEDEGTFAYTLAEQVRLLTKGGYGILSLKKTQNSGYGIGFCKSIENEKPYPRFHMIFGIPFQKPPEIISFHIDRSPHKSQSDFPRKNTEVRRLIGELEKENESVIRDSLLELFRYELLFGNVREINTLLGKTQDERWRKLLIHRKRRRLRGLLKLRFGEAKEKQSLNAGRPGFEPE